MDYAEKYKDAIERASKLKVQNPFDTVGQMVEHIFPELKEKESEDEKIRREIIEFLRLPHPQFVGKRYHEKWIAWLEKQGEKKPNSQMEKCINCQFVYTGYCDGTCILKNNEQKPADKVEPKFKVGDFITNDYCLGKVIEITNDAYLLDTGQGIPFSCEHNAHLWTINDAKDGDVLINWNNTTFIFKVIENETVKFHIAYIETWDTIKTPSTKLSHLGLPEPQSEFHPATKEQRELLFEKMNEAGYEWDSEKKELKKIEVASKESEDERIRKGLIKSVSRIFEGYKLYDTDVTREEALAWLEKQGEQMATPKSK